MAGLTRSPLSKAKKPAATKLSAPSLVIQPKVCVFLIPTLVLPPPPLCTHTHTRHLPSSHSTSEDCLLLRSRPLLMTGKSQQRIVTVNTNILLQKKSFSNFCAISFFTFLHQLIFAYCTKLVRVLNIFTLYDV